MEHPMTRTALAAVLALSLSGGAAVAQHAGHGAAPAPAAAAQDAPSTKAFKEAMTRMHGAMAIPYTGNTDRDFAAGMIPHHQGAIDMARIELQHGTDPAMRKLAEEIIAAQEKEIAQLRAFLARAR
jgi:uncharacterized protein (DUF305 family)